MYHIALLVRENLKPKEQRQCHTIEYDEFWSENQKQEKDILTKVFVSHIKLVTLIVKLWQMAWKKKIQPLE